MIDPLAFVHPTAIVDTEATVGARTKIWHFCHVMKGAEIGEDVVLGQNGFVAGSAKIAAGCRIQNNASIYDGVVLEDGVFVGPSAVFTNVRRPRARFPRKGAYERTLVGEGATIGANATIVCGITIGRFAMIGAGAVVAKDVPEYALIVGNPPRRLGWVCRCGERLEFPGTATGSTCAACRRKYVKKDGDRVAEDT